MFAYLWTRNIFTTQAQFNLYVTLEMFDLKKKIDFMPATIFPMWENWNRFMLISVRRLRNLQENRFPLTRWSQRPRMVRAAGGPPFSITHMRKRRLRRIKTQYSWHSKRMHYPPSRPTCTAAVIATKRQRWRRRNSISSWGGSEELMLY